MPLSGWLKSNGLYDPKLTTFVITATIWSISKVSYILVFEGTYPNFTWIARKTFEHVIEYKNVAKPQIRKFMRNSRTSTLLGMMMFSNASKGLRNYWGSNFVISYSNDIILLVGCCEIQTNSNLIVEVVHW